MKTKQENILAVDLDGTLLKSNLLFETFWNFLGCNIKYFISLILFLFNGKAAFKKYLVENSNIDICSLPYDKKIISYIKSYRETGGKTVLITASNEILAKKISKFLQLFDDVYGSNEKINLKGIKKANFLTEKFGVNNFEYMGDSFDDITVWKVSKKIITVNVSKKLFAITNEINKPIEHLNTRTISILECLKTLRIYQWIKNILIFFPVFIIQKFEYEVLLNTLLAFLAFNFVASSGYIFNDLLDLNSDRLHETKKSRPFASGNVPIEFGSILIITMLILSLTIASLVNTSFLLIIIIYYILTLAYSIILKKIVILDLFFLSSLFTLRIFAGGSAANILISEWLIAFSVFFFLSLVTIKRQAELVHLYNINQKSVPGRSYTIDDLPIINLITLAAGYISVLVLALYINSIAALQLFSQLNAIWGICFVLLYWISKMVFITNRGQMTDDPIIYSMTDKSSLTCLLVIFCLFIIGI